MVSERPIHSHLWSLISSRLGARFTFRPQGHSPVSSQCKREPGHREGLLEGSSPWGSGVNPYTHTPTLATAEAGLSCIQQS